VIAIIQYIINKNEIFVDERCRNQLFRSTFGTSVFGMFLKDILHKSFMLVLVVSYVCYYYNNVQGHNTVFIIIISLSIFDMGRSMKNYIVLDRSAYRYATRQTTHKTMVMTIVRVCEDVMTDSSNT